MNQQSFVLATSQKSSVAPQFLAVVAQGNPQRGTDLPVYLVGSVTPCAPRSGGQRTARPPYPNAELRIFDTCVFPAHTPQHPEIVGCDAAIYPKRVTRNPLVLVYS